MTDQADPTGQNVTEYLNIPILVRSTLLNAWLDDLLYEGDIINVIYTVAKPEFKSQDSEVLNQLRELLDYLNEIDLDTISGKDKKHTLRFIGQIDLFIKILEGDSYLFQKEH